ncbi:Probable inactive receptor kinase [Striga hermonthica]|uniref:Probable inactive receptor kinase n=1 Tax=Striga hermonthica TaxID=68872 RepID=A0A9N7NU77_STRHE|nr:Probable inactive receptor kinase [Striga hermonthica]
MPQNTLGRLNGLNLLSLRSNNLNGNLPSDVLSLTSLRYIDLQLNNFSGDIPLSNFSSQLNVVDFSFNSLTGEIPDAFQNLTALYLQNNSLSGTIPNLDFPNLKRFNVSNNNLSGSIPSHLRTFRADSFSGNSFLCGGPLVDCPSVSPSPSQSFFPPSTSPGPGLGPFSPVFQERSTISTRTIIAIIVGGAAFLVAVALAVLACFYIRRKRSSKSGLVKGKVLEKEMMPKEDFSSGIQDSEKNKLVFFEGTSYNFNLEDLLRASAEILGKGSYGTTYAAILEEGLEVVVKRLREDEKLLVYDDVIGASLSTLLHGDNENGRILDWEQRVKISLDAAKGVAHIHSFKSTHGNIKSSNVLITQDMSAKITDFGLTHLIATPSIPPRSMGYRAPEQVETVKSNQKSDVYAFGVLLLELLTGKAPTQAIGQDEALDLPGWVQSVVREEWTAEVFDANLVRYHKNAEDEMVQLLQIGMACVTKAPERRPAMDEIVRMIEEIRQLDCEDRVPSGKSRSTSPTL